MILFITVSSEVVSLREKLAEALSAKATVSREMSSLEQKAAELVKLSDFGLKQFLERCVCRRDRSERTKPKQTNVKARKQR